MCSELESWTSCMNWSESGFLTLANSLRIFVIRSTGGHPKDCYGRRAFQIQCLLYRLQRGSTYRSDKDSINSRCRSRPVAAAQIRNRQGVQFDISGRIALLR